MKLVFDYIKALYMLRVKTKDNKQEQFNWWICVVRQKEFPLPIKILFLCCFKLWTQIILICQLVN